MKQKKVWDNVAEEWHEFKITPSKNAQEFLKNKKGKILDLGSGSGRNLINLKTKAEIYLVDFSKKMIEFAKQRNKTSKIKLHFNTSSITKLSFKDNFFDYAICVAALHCVETEKKREKTIKELYRVLKPGAKAEIEVWNKNSKRFKNSEKERIVNWRNKGKRYYYLYNEKEIHDLFKKLGFKIIKKIPDNANISFIVKKPIFDGA